MVNDGYAEPDFLHQDVASFIGHYATQCMPSSVSSGLKRSGVFSLLDLVERSEHEIGLCQGVGERNLQKLKQALSFAGLSFGMDAESRRDWSLQYSESRGRALELERVVA